MHPQEKNILANRRLVCYVEPKFDSLALSKLVFLIFAGFFTLFFRWYLTDNLSSGRIRFLAFIRQMNLTVCLLFLVLAQKIVWCCQKNAENTLFLEENNHFLPKISRRRAIKVQLSNSIFHSN